MSDRATPDELRRLMARMDRDKLEDLLAAQMMTAGLPLPIREARFHHVRQWRFDFAWPARRLAVEVEGGEWVRGRHQRPKGFAKDTEKYNAAVALGWRVLRFTGGQVRSGRALATISEVMGNEEW